MVALMVGLLIMTGCDDPTNVGQGLLDSQAGETRVITLQPNSVTAGDRSDPTGGNAASGAVMSLMGVVDDPVRGRMSSQGLIDFVPSNQFGADFLNASVDWAELSLNLDYRYGDTTSVVQFDLYEVPADWQSVAINAGSVIALGSKIDSYEVAAKEGLTSFVLPEAWIQEYDTILRDGSFSDLFHGFAMVPTDGQAIVGFRFSESTLRASATPGDTVAFALSKVGSLTSMPDSPPSSGRVFLGDGSARGVDVRFPLQGEELAESLIHRVILSLEIDNISSSYPAGFLRPLPAVIGLEAVSEDGESRLEIAEVAVNTEGRFVMDNTTLTNVFQSANLGKSVLDRFELYFPTDQSGVGFFVLPTTANELAIEALVTATPIN